MKPKEFAEVHCEATKRSEAAVQERLKWLTEYPKGYLPAAFHSPVEKVEDPFDLENLRYREPVFDEKRKKQILVTPDLIKSFVDCINELPDEGKPFIVGIGTGTGGTPSMDNHETGGSLGTKFGFNGLMNHPKINPRLQEEFEVLGIDLFKTDSSQLQIDDVGDMTIAMSYIWQNMRPGLKKRFLGFTIIHGTDTMSKSGAHLATMHGKGLPYNVVHVGAQRSIEDDKTDFPINYEHSFDTHLILDNSGFTECVTVMGRKALLTIGTNKVSGYKPEAMQSPRHNTVIDFNKDIDPEDFKIRVQGVYKSKDKDVPFAPFVYRGPNRIETINAEMSEDPTRINAIMEFTGAKAFLVVPYLGGTYDAADIDRIAFLAKRYIHLPKAQNEVGSARANDFPLFAVHQADEKTDLRRYAAAESEFINAGVIPLNMTANAARSKIMRALALCVEGEVDFKKLIENEVTTDLIGESSNIGERYMDRFDPVDINDMEPRVSAQESTLCRGDISFGGEYAQTQIKAMAEIGFRCDNLNHIVNSDKAFLIANIAFWDSLLDEIGDFRRTCYQIQEGIKPWMKPDPARITAMYKKINEVFIPQVVTVLTDAEATTAFMNENGIEINLNNFMQLRDEMLFIWSQLTNNNLIFTRNTQGIGGAEKYVPLVQPDIDGIIRRIDHDQRVNHNTIAYEKLSVEQAEYKQILRQNLDTFINGDFTRAGTVNDKSPEWEEMRDNPELPRLLVEVSEEVLSGSQLHRINRIITYLADSLDGYQTFERPQLQGMRKKIAKYLISEIEKLTNQHNFSLLQLFKDLDIGPLIHYIVGIGIYSELDENSSQIIDELRRIAKETH